MTFTYPVLHLRSKRCKTLVLAMLLTAALTIGCGQQVEAPPSQDRELISPSPASVSEDSMVLIPAGRYPIGSDAVADAAPQHQVEIAAFRMDQYEVTNGQYAEFLNALNLQPLRNAPAGQVHSSDLPEAAIPQFIEGAEGQQQNLLIALDDEHSRIAIQDGQFVTQTEFVDHPVTETTWRGAYEYCKWRSARLPTEVEWEAAARGLKGRSYPWGEAPPTPEQAVYGRSSGATAAVGTHPAGATPEGIHDLAGNVAEWTHSLYRSYPYQATDGREDSEVVGERVTRGGDHVFDSAPDELTTFFRVGFSRAPDRGHRHIGFRCAQSVP